MNDYHYIPNKIKHDAPDIVKQYVDNLVFASEQYRKWRLEAAELNENYVYGNQDKEIDTEKGGLRNRKYRYRFIKHNYLRHLRNIVTSRLLKDRPSGSAYPTQPQAKDRGAAKVAAAYIEHQELELGIDDILQEVTDLGIMHGTAGFKIVFNPDTERIEWLPQSLFDFHIDPKAKDIEDAKWVLFVDYLDKEEAQQLLPVDFGGIDLETATYKPSVEDEELEGVKCLELWHLPTAKVPQGLYCKIVGGELVESIPYPYMLPDRETDQLVPMLPFSYFRTFKKRGSPYGDTWLDDAVDIQFQINETESNLQHLENLTGNIRVIGPKVLIDQLRNKNQFIVAADDTQNLRNSPQPEIPPLLLANRDWRVQKLFDIAGVNITAGGYQSPKSGSSAKQIAYLYELDAEKHAATSKSIEKMLLRAWRIDLSLAQAMYSLPRLLKVGDGDSLNTLQFIGADLSGTDVRLEPRTGIERYSASKGQSAVEQAQQGLMDPAKATEVVNTGLSESAYETYVKRLVDFEVESVLKGASITPQAEPSLAIPYLQQIVVALQEQGDPKAYLVNNLLMMYQQVISSKEYNNA